MIYWACGALVVALLMFAPILGYLSSPLAPFWLKGSNAIPPAVIVEPMAIESMPDAPPTGFVPIPGTGRHLSDRQRFDLARIAGWTVQDAIIATAISIAENGSGDPAAMSGKNRDGSVDFCLWQVNSRWHQRFGGMAALADPSACAQAAHTIYGIQGWCAWSTYEASCGPGHTGSYRSYLQRAMEASRAMPPTNQG